MLDGAIYNDVFNAVNHGGRVNYVDGQAGTFGTLVQQAASAPDA